ncbi:proline-rich protein 2-like [Cervus elaphus]|uniref:proline-rich protein 2-like n=1 Tax=Cervus elaphus TaxID=9860 RepID=UPI001CC2F85A|nr:proline-rich protein 2-like [Cervus elaphus]
MVVATKIARRGQTVCTVERELRFEPEPRAGAREQQAPPSGSLPRPRLVAPPPAPPISVGLQLRTPSARKHRGFPAGGGARLARHLCPPQETWQAEGPSRFPGPSSPRGPHPLPRRRPASAEGSGGPRSQRARPGRSPPTAHLPGVRRPLPARVPVTWAPPLGPSSPERPPAKAPSPPAALKPRSAPGAGPGRASPRPALSGPDSRLGPGRVGFPTAPQPHLIAIASDQAPLGELWKGL